jgi:hypothetical protein
VSPKPVKTAKRTFWLATHWKIALVLAVVLGPLFFASYLRCSRTADGCSVFELVVGAVTIVAGWFT